MMALQRNEEEKKQKEKKAKEVEEANKKLLVRLVGEGNSSLSLLKRKKRKKRRLPRSSVPRVYAARLRPRSSTASSVARFWLVLRVTCFALCSHLLSSGPRCSASWSVWPDGQSYSEILFQCFARQLIQAESVYTVASNFTYPVMGAIMMVLPLPAPSVSTCASVLLDFVRAIHSLILWTVVSAAMVSLMPSQGMGSHFVSGGSCVTCRAEVDFPPSSWHTARDESCTPAQLTPAPWYLRAHPCELDCVPFPLCLYVRRHAEMVSSFLAAYGAGFQGRLVQGPVPTKCSDKTFLVPGWSRQCSTLWVWHFIDKKLVN